MGRHRTQDEKLELGERARELRAAGRSRREIQRELGIGDELCGQLLRGTAIPDPLARPRAKDEVRDVAVALRSDGWTYDQIAEELGVSKSTCSLWLRDMPRPEPGPPLDISSEPIPAVPEPPVSGNRAMARHLRGKGLLLKEIAEQMGISLRSASLYTRGMPWPARSKHGGDDAQMRAMSQARWADHRRRRDIAEQQRKLEAALQVGAVDAHALLLLGAVAYWCEGSKSKPWRRQGKWTFVNSDPLLIRLMVLWLRLVGIAPNQWVVRIQIHETGDLVAAEAHWRHVLGVPDIQFAKATIKRHKPLTNRKNTGGDYFGCLSIYVRQGAPLLHQVEGWVVGALLGSGGALPSEPMLDPTDATLSVRGLVP